MHQIKNGDIVRVRKEYCDNYPEAYTNHNFGYRFLKTDEREKFFLLGGANWDIEISINDLELWFPKKGDIVSITNPIFHDKSMILWCVNGVSGNTVDCSEYGDFGLYDGATVDVSDVIPYNLKEHILYPSMWKEAKQIISEHFPDAIDVFTHIESWRGVHIPKF